MVRGHRDEHGYSVERCRDQQGIGHVAVVDGVLYALVGTEEHRDETIRGDRTQAGWPWRPMTSGYDRADYAWGFGLTLFAVDLYFAQPNGHATQVSTIAEFLARPGGLRIWIDLAMIGAFGGFYSVPLYALIQKRSERRHLSRIIAANNIINAVLMVGNIKGVEKVIADDMRVPAPKEEEPEEPAEEPAEDPQEKETA